MNEDFANYEHKKAKICQLTHALDNQVYFTGDMAPNPIAFCPQIAEVLLEVDKQWCIISKNSR